MTGFVVPAHHVPRIGPRGVRARDRATRDEAFRHRMVQFMLLCSLVLVPLPEDVVQRVEEYAASSASTTRCSASPTATRTAASASRSSTSSAAATWRRGTPRTPPRCTRRRQLTDAWDQCVLRSRRSPQQWEAFRELARRHARARGREVLRRARVRVPGPARQCAAAARPARLGARARRLRLDGRVRARGVRLHRASQRRPARVLVAGDDHQPVRDRAISRSARGLFQYDRGHLSHEGMAVRLADAMRRGALCGAHAGGPDLLMHDWFADADRPVEDVRAEFGVVPKAGARGRAGSVTPWEPRRHLAVPVRLRAHGPRKRPAASTTPTARSPRDRRDDGATLEAFSDARRSRSPITLLVLEIRVPDVPRASIARSRAPAELWPKYAAFAVSFVTIGIMWINHHAVVPSASRTIDRRVAVPQPRVARWRSRSCRSRRRCSATYVRRRRQRPHRGRRSCTASTCCSSASDSSACGVRLLEPSRAALAGLRATPACASRSGARSSAPSCTCRRSSWRSSAHRRRSCCTPRVVVYFAIGHDLRALPS